MEACCDRTAEDESRSLTCLARLPNTNNMASITLLLPLPLGPTTDEKHCAGPRKRSGLLPSVVYFHSIHIEHRPEVSSSSSLLFLGLTTRRNTTMSIVASRSLFVEWHRDKFRYLTFMQKYNFVLVTKSAGSEMLTLWNGPTL